MIEKITNAVDDFIDYIKNGKVTEVIVACSEDDEDFGKTIANSMDANYFVAKSVKFDEDDDIDLVSGKMVIATKYAGNLFVSASISSATVYFEKEA